MSHFDEIPGDTRYEGIAMEIAGSLGVVYDNMWLYDFKGAYQTVSRLLNVLESQGINIESLLDEARKWKKMIKKKAEGTAVPDHRYTILAPVASKLRKLEGNLRLLLRTYGEALASISTVYKGHVIVDLENYYLIRHMLPKPLGELGKQLVEDSVKSLFNPGDMEFYANSKMKLVTAKLWVDNTIIDFSIIQNRLDCRVMPPPKKKNLETAERIVDRFIELYEKLGLG